MNTDTHSHMHAYVQTSEHILAPRHTCATRQPRAHQQQLEPAPSVLPICISKASSLPHHTIIIIYTQQLSFKSRKDPTATLDFLVPSASNLLQHEHMKQLGINSHAQLHSHARTHTPLMHTHIIHAHTRSRTHTHTHTRLSHPKCTAVVSTLQQAVRKRANKRQCLLANLRVGGHFVTKCN